MSLGIEISPSFPLGKGTGLKKWKRIKRDASILVGGTNVEDNSKLVKRILPNFATNLNNPKDFSALMKQTSEGSVSSSNALLQSFGDALVDSFGGILDSEFVIRPILTAGTESDNSEEDRDSDVKMSQNLGNSVINGHQGKPKTESSKKARGGSVKSEKEYSFSSMESVFVQGSYSSTINGGRNGIEQAESGMKIAEFEDIFAADLDPLVESMILLQSVQQLLGKEVEKFKDIGNEDLITTEELSESGELIQESFDIFKSDATSFMGTANSSKNDVAKVILDMELELETLYIQKIEVEIEYIAIKTSLQIKIFEEKNKEQAQLHMKLGHVKKQSKKSDFCWDNESLKLKSSVWKYTSFLVLQFFLLFAVFIWIFLPNQQDFLPT